MYRVPVRLDKVTEATHTNRGHSYLVHEEVRFKKLTGRQKRQNFQKTSKKVQETKKFGPREI